MKDILTSKKIVVVTIILCAIYAVVAFACFYTTGKFSPTEIISGVERKSVDSLLSIIFSIALAFGAWKVSISNRKM